MSELEIMFYKIMSLFILSIPFVSVYLAFNHEVTEKIVRWISRHQNK